MSHNHDHGHGLGRGSGDFRRAFAIGVTLNVAFVIVEATYGYLADSLALLADAGHNLSDVLGLLLAWGAILLAARKPTRKRTYGFRRATILASLFSALLLLVALGAITWEAIGRFAEPKEVSSGIIILVASVGVVINSATALLFVSGRKSDLNIKGAYLHMAADAGVSLGVVGAGLVIGWTGWLWFDPAISIVIVLIILRGTWGLLRDSINLSIDAVPEGIDISGIEEYLKSLKNVVDLHDLHVWALSTTETALTVHLLVSPDTVDNDFIEETVQVLNDRFSIEHATIQLEKEEDGNCCPLDRPECV